MKSLIMKMHIFRKIVYKSAKHYRYILCHNYGLIINLYLSYTSTVCVLLLTQTAITNHCCTVANSKSKQN